MGECKDQILGSCELLGFTSLQLKITGQRTIKESFREESTLEEYVMDTNDDEEQEAERPHKRRRVPRSRVGGKTMKETSVDVGDITAVACKLCPEKCFRSSQEFESHLSSEHFLTDLVQEFGSEDDKLCNICEDNFDSEEDLAQHIGTRHSKVMMMYERKLEEYSTLIIDKYGVDRAECSLCKIKFKNVKLLGNHIGAVHEKFMECLVEEEKERKKAEMEIL